uniref:Bestrophin homolog n=1 Tax=Romanomermis culicivorax TaxID=13658 RepID=A0A915I9Q8_ROMCU
MNFTLSLIIDVLVEIRTIKRFPTLQHFVTAGLMTDAELKTYETVDAPHGKWWVPLVWVSNLLKKCQEEKVIDSVLLKCLMKEVLSFRLGLVMLIVYDWMSIPLVYTQIFDGFTDE